MQITFGARSEFRKKTLKFESNGFSLIEMLAVVLIVGLLVSVSVGYMQEGMIALKISGDGSQVESMFSSAQQAASSEGRNIEVRIYKHDDPQQGGDARFRSIVLMRYYQAGEPNPAPGSGGAPLIRPLALVSGEIFTLSSGVVFSEAPSMSTLLTGPTRPAGGIETKIITSGRSEAWEFPRDRAEYHSFVIRPEGTSLNPSDKWFISLVSTREQDSADVAAAANFYCVQIDPGTARVTSYRPDM